MLIVVAVPSPILIRLDSTSSRAEGEAVPIPTLPVSVTLTSSPELPVPPEYSLQASESNLKVVTAELPNSNC